jgi:hypothetical protein
LLLLRKIKTNVRSFLLKEGSYACQIERYSNKG